MAEEQIILEAQGLTKEFKGFVAVRDVNLRVQRHTIHALIGPNGAGKTTCFNLLTHFLTPTAGRIRFNGRNITGSSPAAIARMGLARSFQISAVFPHLSVRENVRVALQRKLGISFHFWRSERVLKDLDARAVAADSMSDPAKAAERTAAWGKIFTDIMADAPWIPVINERRVVAKSLRMGGADNIYIDPTRVINYDAIYVKQ